MGSRDYYPREPDYTLTAPQRNLIRIKPDGRMLVGHRDGDVIERSNRDRIPPLVEEVLHHTDDRVSGALRRELWDELAVACVDAEETLCDGAYPSLEAFLKSRLPMALDPWACSEALGMLRHRRAAFAVHGIYHLLQEQ